jgi:hypothetical protein
MSLRFEQRNALVKARNLLRDCLDPQKRPKTVKELRERAYSRCGIFRFSMSAASRFGRKMTLSRDSIAV